LSESVDKGKSKAVPAVFTRLWRENQSREAKNRLTREKSREDEENVWKQKLAGVNQLQKSFQGMTVYQDRVSGKCFVHINELRQQVLQQTNTP